MSLCTAKGQPLPERVYWVSFQARWCIQALSSEVRAQAWRLIQLRTVPDGRCPVKEQEIRLRESLRDSVKSFRETTSGRGIHSGFLSSLRSKDSRESSAGFQRTSSLPENGVIEETSSPSLKQSKEEYCGSSAISVRFDDQALGITISSQQEEQFDDQALDATRNSQQEEQSSNV